MKQILFLTLCMCAAFNASAARWYVSPTGTATSATSWANPAGLKTALAGASSGDEIWVKAGVYYAYNTSPSDAFVLRSGVLLYGGFTGTETTLAQRDFVTNETVLDGTNIAGIPTSEHVVIASGTSASTKIDGFKITNGSAGSLTGGGLYCNIGSPNIINCLFVNNTCSTTSDGAAVGLSGASVPKIQNCTFKDNSGRSVIYTGTGNQVKIQNCTFTYNQGNVISGTANIDRCKMSGNTTSSAVIVSLGSLTLTNSLIVGNSSSSNIIKPGSLDVYKNNTIAHNSCTSYSINWSNTTGESFHNNHLSSNSLGYLSAAANNSSNNYIGSQFLNPGTIADSPFDANDYDYHLPVGSPLINAGSNAFVVGANDLDNMPRIVGSSVDIGAYESNVVSTFFDKDLSAAVAISPNPSTGFCTIDIQGLDHPETLSVIDLTGKVLLTQTATATLQPLDLSALPNGQYIVSILTETYTVNKKIVLTR